MKRRAGVRVSGLKAKRRKYASTTVAVPRGVFSTYSGPSKFRAKATIKYADYFSLNPGASSFASYVFSANGCFDPNISGVGHQPRGFDQWMAMYQRYTVIASKISIVCANTLTGAPQENILVSVWPTVNTVVPLSFPYDLIEPKGAKWMAFTNGNTLTVTKPNPKLINYINCLQWFSKANTDDDTISGLSSSNPTRQVYWVIACGLDGGSDIAQINFTVDIEYYVQFDIPQDLGTS